MVEGLHHCEICLAGTQIWFQSESSEEVSEAFSSHLCVRDLLLNLRLTCFVKAPLCLFFRAERKHIKSVTVNRGSDFTSTSPLGLIGEIVPLCTGDTYTQMKYSNSQSPRDFKMNTKPGTSLLVIFTSSYFRNCVHFQ